MEKEDPQNDGKEATNCSHNPIHGHIQPLLEEDGRAGHDRGGEEDIIDRSDDGSVKDVKGFVQVVDLDTDTDHQADD